MNNVYGTKRPANITSNDVEIYYHYRPNRCEDDPGFPTFKKLSSSYLTKSKYGDTKNENEFELPGMYNLRLPVNDFKQTGVYTIYIKPKEIITNIIDVSTLAAFPSVKGIVINDGALNDSSISTNGGLTGYRVEYFDDDDNRIQDFRIITSSNRCEPVSQNMNDSMQKGVRYRFNDSSNLIFCTLTPSSASSFKANSEPFIGNTSQKIALVSTKFNPVCLEIEMVEHDAETISWMLEGDQLRNLDKGLITTFTKEGAIYHQSKTGHITDIEDGVVHDFKINSKNDIDFSEDIENIKSQI